MHEVEGSSSLAQLLTPALQAPGPQPEQMDGRDHRMGKPPLSVQPSPTERREQERAVVWLNAWTDGAAQHGWTSVASPDGCSITD